MAPASPDALLINGTPLSHDLCGETEQTVDHKWLHGRTISTTHNLRIEMQDYNGRTRVGREVRKRLPIAQAYEAAMEHAREASGYVEAEEARYWSALALMKLADEAFGLEASSMSDVAVKACAFNAGGYCDSGAPYQIATRQPRPDHRASDARRRSPRVARQGHASNSKHRGRPHAATARRLRMENAISHNSS
jgi:hypothetical protein